MNELHTKHFVKVVFCEQLCYTNYVDATVFNKISKKKFSEKIYFIVLFLIRKVKK